MKNCPPFIPAHCEQHGAHLAGLTFSKNLSQFWVESYLEEISSKELLEIIKLNTDLEQNGIFRYMRSFLK